jgi:amino acid transporter
MFGPDPPFVGQLTGPCSVGYALAYMILTAAAIGNPNYTIQTWHIYLMLLAILIVSGLITMQSTKIIGRINVVGTWINLIALIIFVIWLPAGSINRPRFNSDKVVWTSEGFVNGTEWPIGFATLMGFLSVIWTMSGKLGYPIFAPSILINLQATTLLFIYPKNVRTPT